MTSRKLRDVGILTQDQFFTACAEFAIMENERLRAREAEVDAAAREGLRRVGVWPAARAVMGWTDAGDYAQPILAAWRAQHGVYQTVSGPPANNIAEMADSAGSANIA